MILWNKVALGLVGAVGLFVVVGLFLPRTAHVARSIEIQAAPATVFTVLNGFRQFGRWSPWSDKDPQMKVAFEGPESGIGAKMSWTGNSAVGTGSQEIVDSQAPGKVVVKLGFGGFSGEFQASYLLAAEGDGTRVTWAFNGDYGSNIIGRYFGLLADRMLGPDYDKGLARLKSLVEGLPKSTFSDLQITTVETQAGPLLLYGAHSADEPNAIGVALGVGYSKLAGFINSKGLNQVAPPVAIFYGENQGGLSLDAGIPVDRDDGAMAAPIRMGHSHAGRALRGVYRGPYAGLPGAREGLNAFVAASGYVQDGPRWEQYVSDPSRTVPAELVTYLFVPIR